MLRGVASGVVVDELERIAEDEPANVLGLQEVAREAGAELADRVEALELIRATARRRVRRGSREAEPRCAHRRSGRCATAVRGTHAIATCAGVAPISSATARPRAPWRSSSGRRSRSARASSLSSRYFPVSAPPSSIPHDVKVRSSERAIGRSSRSTSRSASEYGPWSATKRDQPRSSASVTA